MKLHYLDTMLLNQAASYTSEYKHIANPRKTDDAILMYFSLAIAGILIFALVFRVLRLLIPNLREQIVEKQNLTAAVLVVGVWLGISLLAAAVIG